jgi:hypothetical protein
MDLLVKYEKNRNRFAFYPLVNWTQYYKHITIVNDNSGIVNKFETSLTDDARVIIYNRNMFIVQATDLFIKIITNHRWITKYYLCSLHMHWEFLMNEAPSFTRCQLCSRI